MTTTLTKNQGIIKGVITIKGIISLRFDLTQILDYHLLKVNKKSCLQIEEDNENNEETEEGSSLA